MLFIRVPYYTGDLKTEPYFRKLPLGSSPQHEDRGRRGQCKWGPKCAEPSDASFDLSRNLGRPLGYSTYIPLTRQPSNPEYEGNRQLYSIDLGFVGVGGSCREVLRGPKCMLCWRMDPLG